ncbi:sulfurtransferase TusA family protein [Streptomyces sp. NPDC013953]|uniref:sulfurtransferase TusA family protein n=1 Tax=Streptomyces sp. NPDC013953 TaxID=3364868 RepID=UPI0036F72560
MTALSVVPPADITVDGTGLLCVTLLLRLRRQIDGAAAGTVVHVIATDPAAPLDLPAWCHMTDHTSGRTEPANRCKCSGRRRARCSPGPTHPGIDPRRSPRPRP